MSRPDVFRSIPESQVDSISYSDAFGSFGNRHISGGETIDYNPNTGRIVNVNGLSVLRSTNVTILPVYSIEDGTGSAASTSTSNSQDQTAAGTTTAGAGDVADGPSAGRRVGPLYGTPTGAPGEVIYSGFQSAQAAGVAMSLFAKRKTNGDPQHLEYGGAIFSYQENGVTVYGVTAPTAGGLPYVRNGLTYYPGAPVSSANVPSDGVFLGGYHSHQSGATFSDDGHGVGDIPSVLRGSTNSNKSISLYLGRDGGAFGTKTTVEVATGTQVSGAWTVKTKVIGTYP